MAKDLSDEEIQDLIDKVLPPYYQAIGKVASVWAEFEQTMDRLIWDLAVVEHALGACVTSQLNGPTPRVRVLLTLLHLRGWPDDTIKKFRRFDGQIRDLQEARNRAIHDMILVGHETGRVFRRTVATFQNKLMFQTAEHSLQTLKEVFDGSRRLLRQFNALTDEVRHSVPELSPAKLRELRRRIGPESDLPLTIRSQSGR